MCSNTTATNAAKWVSFALLSHRARRHARSSRMSRYFCIGNGIRGALIFVPSTWQVDSRWVRTLPSSGRPAHLCHPIGRKWSPNGTTRWRSFLIHQRVNSSKITWATYWSILFVIYLPTNLKRVVIKWHTRNYTLMSISSFPVTLDVFLRKSCSYCSFEETTWKRPGPMP